MRNKSDSLPKSKKMLIAVICIVATIAITLFCIERRIRSFSEEMGTYYCHSKANEAISSSVKVVMEETGAEYSDLSVTVYDEDGKISSSQLCTKNLNILQSMIMTEINSSFERLSESEINIPLGTLSGFYLLNGRGPEITVKLLPVGSADTELKREFVSAGINQTCHKISLDVKARLKAVFPSGSEEITVNLNCILAENIIVGDVPEGFVAMK